MAVATAAYLYLRREQRERQHTEETKQLSLIINKAMETHPFLSLSATQLAEKIAMKEVTATHVISMFIKQIKDTNPYLNAVCDTRFEEALEEAKVADEMLAGITTQSELESLRKEKPFLGVPFIAKECFEIPGMKYTGGLISRKDVVGEQWNPVVWRVRQTGAILLATGNTSEVCLWSESENKVYGRSKNPYDLSRTVGGMARPILHGLC